MEPAELPDDLDPRGWIIFFLRAFERYGASRSSADDRAEPPFEQKMHTLLSAFEQAAVKIALLEAGKAYNEENRAQVGQALRGAAEVCYELSQPNKERTQTQEQGLVERVERLALLLIELGERYPYSDEIAVVCAPLRPLRLALLRFAQPNASATKPNPATQAASHDFERVVQDFHEAYPNPPSRSFAMACTKILLRCETLVDLALHAPYSSPEIAHAQQLKLVPVLSELRKVCVQMSSTKLRDIATECAITDVLIAQGGRLLSIVEAQEEPHQAIVVHELKYCFNVFEEERKDLHYQQSVWRASEEAKVRQFAVGTRESARRAPVVLRNNF